MKRKSFMLLLAAALIGSLIMNTAQANDSKPQPKGGIIYRTPAPQRLANPLRIHAGRLLNVQSLLHVGYMSTRAANAQSNSAQKSMTNSIIYVNRPNGWDIYGADLWIHFKDGSTIDVYIPTNPYPGSIPNGGSATFTVPDLSNIASIELGNATGYPFVDTEYFTVSTDGGAVSATGRQSPTGSDPWVMEAFGIDHTKNGVTITVY